MNQQNWIQITAAENMKLIYKTKQYVSTLTKKASKLDLHCAGMELDEKKDQRIRLGKIMHFSNFCKRLETAICLFVCGKELKNGLDKQKGQTMEEKNVQHWIFFFYFIKEKPSKSVFTSWAKANKLINNKVTTSIKDSIMFKMTNWYSYELTSNLW